MKYHLYMGGVMSVIQLLLGIYLEIVLPKDYGSSKPPLFMCQSKTAVDSRMLL